ncbi:hypothetical protein Nepgr_007896 [Nepenthes gracilis]|uniref:Uncharacterized protein n=1 Tax=Nepenthes gracilis TaxID=150966 RepID=A0AAD3S841_NEPGR|nr:hypothetical protein Nepgr_007896 [Nepenthes gracilis]
MNQRPAAAGAPRPPPSASPAMVGPSMTPDSLQSQPSPSLPAFDSSYWVPKLFLFSDFQSSNLLSRLPVLEITPPGPPSSTIRLFDAVFSSRPSSTSPVSIPIS